MKKTLKTSLKSNVKKLDDKNVTWNKVDLEVDDVASFDGAGWSGHPVAAELQLLPVRHFHSSPTATDDVDAVNRFVIT